MKSIQLAGLALVGLITASLAPLLAQNYAGRRAPAVALAAPTVRIRLPERFRVLTKQLFDLRVEAVNASPTATIQIVIDGTDVTATLPTPEFSTNNDADTATPDAAWVYRSVHLDTSGVRTIVANVSDAGQLGTITQRVGVQDFNPGNLPKKNIILFLGDAMGTAYRDAGRIVAQSTNNRFREGFFDQLQNMDTMAASGMVMTYDLDRIVPDSSPTASAWSTGNKTSDGTHGVFPDNNDFKFNSSAATLQATKQFALDNPKVETLWEYLRRLYGYKTGVVSTADIADATPGGEGSHTLIRALTYDIARQYVDGTFTPGPVHDVILGGGREHFEPATVNAASTTLAGNGRNPLNSGDNRNLITELTTNFGFTYTPTRTQLNAVRAQATPPDRLIGLFWGAAGGTNGGTTSGTTLAANTGANGNMNVAYDKLGLARTADEPAANLNGFTDQPFLDEMTDAAIRVLSKGGAPFILMVEGASIDKQSHPNHAAGVIWDVIEFDKAVGVGRAFSNAALGKTLVLVTADHDQSMSIVGLTDSANGSGVLNTRSQSLYPRTISVFDPILSGTTAAPNNGGNNTGEVGGFPDYVEAPFSPNGVSPVFPIYPTNVNRYKIAVGFRTGNHTGSSVPITADGPGSLLFTGYFDQTDIFFKMARVLSTDTAPLDEYSKLVSKRYSTVSPNY